MIIIIFGKKCNNEKKLSKKLVPCKGTDEDDSSEMETFLMFLVFMYCMYVCEFLCKTLNYHIHLTIKTIIYQYNSRILLFEASV